jgi:hypothetical protein
MLAGTILDDGITFAGRFRATKALMHDSPVERPATTFSPMPIALS